MEKKGSVKVLKWTEKDKESFGELKRLLAGELEVYHLDPDKSFILRADASNKAVGAVLEQEVDGVWHPVVVFSRKLGKSQWNWTPREREPYAVVSTLRR